jgi:hypothetical protein
MRRLLILTAAAGALVLLIRIIAKTAGPGLQARCSDMCDRMIDKMPDSFPPKRMMSDLESIKNQTADILDQLRKTSETGGAEA